MSLRSFKVTVVWALSLGIVKDSLEEVSRVYKMAKSAASNHHYLFAIMKDTQRSCVPPPHPHQPKHTIVIGDWELQESSNEDRDEGGDEGGD